MKTLGDFREAFKDLPDNTPLICCTYTGNPGTYYKVKSMKFCNMYSNGDGTFLYVSKRVAEQKRHPKVKQEPKAVLAIVMKDFR